MGEYIKDKNRMKFQNQDSLKTVISVIDEVDKALNSPSRTIVDSEMSEILTETIGIGDGTGIGFAPLFYMGKLQDQVY